jgi:hypothetical protein
MNLQMSPRISWSTAAFGDAANISPVALDELDELGQHMQQCSHLRSRAGRHFFALRCGVDRLHQGLVARFVTSLTLVLALVGTTVLVW